jgi:hypothetical protein
MPESVSGGLRTAVVPFDELSINIRPSTEAQEALQRALTISIAQKAIDKMLEWF